DLQTDRRRGAVGRRGVRRPAGGDGQGRRWPGDREGAGGHQGGAVVRDRRRPGGDRVGGHSCLQRARGCPSGPRAPQAGRPPALRGQAQWPRPGVGRRLTTEGRAGPGPGVRIASPTIQRAVGPTRGVMAPRPWEGASMSPLDPKRTVLELKDLRSRTGDENGAWRVAWTDTWLEARAWLREKLDALGLETTTDAAGNVWSTLRGESDTELLIGGHMDSVPGGGWLDGCLNVLAGLESIRRIKEQYGGKPPVTVRLVDWADEEGARFGRSLMGSSAAGGTLVPDEERDRKDKDGV